jgi:uncharacterized protein YigE (DUF2233 family)
VSSSIKVSIFLLVWFGLNSQSSSKNVLSPQFISYTLNPTTQDLQLYWKNDKGQILRSISNLRTWLGSQHRELLFAMNGGMYMQNNAPLGLFVQNGKMLARLNKRIGKGNFYLQPNGVFYVSTDRKVGICKTRDYSKLRDIRFATQSGPLLLVDGKINPLFEANSQKLNIRNGVGILPNNKVVFVLSKVDVNFYEFANYFKALGCTNALFLDGCISQIYLPKEHWIHTDGDFGVIIGVTAPR